MDRLARSPRYLRFAGKGLQKMFHVQRDMIDLSLSSVRLGTVADKSVPCN